jgi:chromosome segregation ATPase
MATANLNTQCSICKEETSTFICRGCSQDFCFDHLQEHRQLLNAQLHHIQNDFNQFRQKIIDLKSNPQKHPLMKQIDQWEKDSIDKIKQRAKECQEKLINYTNKIVNQIEIKLDDPNEQLKPIQKKNEYNENDLKRFKEKLNKLKKELNQSENILIKQQLNSFINQIFIKCGKFLELNQRYGIFQKNQIL